MGAKWILRGRLASIWKQLSDYRCLLSPSWISLLQITLEHLSIQTIFFAASCDFGLPLPSISLFHPKRIAILKAFFTKLCQALLLRGRRDRCTPFQRLPTTSAAQGLWRAGPGKSHCRCSCKVASVLDTEFTWRALDRRKIPFVPRSMEQTSCIGGRPARI